AGEDVSLNGAGLRTKVWKLYACGLYVARPTNDAEELIRNGQVKHMELHMLRDLTKEQVGKTIREGFEKNSRAELPSLAARLDRLTSALPDVKRGEVLTVTYVPGRGTTVQGPRNEAILLEGDDFMRALFSVWLGPRPVQSSLKRQLLGASIEDNGAGL
ncbi:MAG: chalcone isomerase family protein, partial [Myxococcota bacterium]